jgi:hypothetical protein
MAIEWTVECRKLGPPTRVWNPLTEAAGALIAGQTCRTLIKIVRRFQPVAQACQACKRPGDWSIFGPAIRTFRLIGVPQSASRSTDQRPARICASTSVHRLSARTDTHQRQSASNAAGECDSAHLNLQQPGRLRPASASSRNNPYAPPGFLNLGQPDDPRSDAQRRGARYLSEVWHRSRPGVEILCMHSSRCRCQAAEGQQCS